MKIQAVLLICLLHGVLGDGSLEATRANHILENHQSAYNAAQVSRSSQPVYAQSRDSYANAAAQAGYSVGGATNNHNGGAGGGNIVAAASNSYGVPAAAASSSYGVPATAGGYGSGGQAAGSNPAMTYYYYHYPAGQGAAQASTGWGSDTTGYDDDEGFGGGLGGLAGLFGLKGLKGLGGLGLLALLKLLKPLLLPLALPLLLPLLLLLLLPLLLFLPVPVITIPSQGRSLESSSVGEYISEKVYGGVQTVQKVLGSEKCVERIACEISHQSRGSFLDSVVQGLSSKVDSYLPKTFRRGMRAYVDSSSDSKNNSKCAKYTCSAFRSISATTTDTDKSTSTNEGSA